MNIKYNGSNSLTFLLNLINSKFGTKVDKVEGKGLSTNDYDNTEKQKVTDAYTHSTSSHAPADAERNIVVGIQKNGIDVAPDTNRKVNIIVPTKTSEITNDSGYITESQVPEGAVASTTTPKMDGTAAVGTENAFARGDHTHPSDSTKVDKVSGKQLSTEDYTTEEKTKLAGIAANANNYTHPSYNSTTSGLYKVTVDGQGHVSATTAVTKEDITGLGIPGSVPKVPSISVDVNADATSDTKTVSPKAVKSYVDGKVSSTYKPAGSLTFATLPTPTSTVLGNVYNVTDAFTTNDNFIEGAGKKHPAGTNVVVISAGTSTYKYDVLAGFVDLSEYAKTADFTELTNEEIQTIWDAVFSS